MATGYALAQASPEYPNLIEGTNGETEDGRKYSFIISDRNAGLDSGLLYAECWPGISSQILFLETELGDLGDNRSANILYSTTNTEAVMSRLSDYRQSTINPDRVDFTIEGVSDVYAFFDQFVGDQLSVQAGSFQARWPLGSLRRWFLNECEIESSVSDNWEMVQTFYYVNQSTLIGSRTETTANLHLVEYTDNPTLFITFDEAEQEFPVDYPTFANVRFDNMSVFYRTDPGGDWKDGSLSASVIVNSTTFQQWAWILNFSSDVWNSGYLEIKYSQNFVEHSASWRLNPRPWLISGRR